MKYIDLYNSGELLERVKSSYRELSNCRLCPHKCGVNRIKGEKGICKSGFLPKIASANLHKGEEPPISGTRGSGTIFFSGCSLSCSFCQNFPISQMGNGEEITTKELGERMLRLQKMKVHNINFVTPTHFLPQILAALWQVIPEGFSLPIVWNSSGYELPEMLALLDGVVSIYLPDMKYSDDNDAMQLSSAKDYRDTNRKAISTMFKQVGHLKTDKNGLGEGGLI
ncbi:MAG: 4Fe-4S cluster-binding domain-containing protein, partial [Desulfuromonadales bacterium]|nr:4Fe-4S cluster-binding domain-containing protein [Desulfuromonadales bacterium]